MKIADMNSRDAPQAARNAIIVQLALWNTLAAIEGFAGQDLEGLDDKIAEACASITHESFSSEVSNVASVVANIIQAMIADPS